MLKVTRNNETGKFEVYADAEMFIIPNHAGKLDNFFAFSRERIANKIEKLCCNNHYEFDRERDLLVEIWMLSDDLDSDNMNCHGSYFEYEGKKYVISALPSYIPKNLIDIKENQKVTLRYNGVRCRDYDGKNNFEVDLLLNLKANQLDYRYCRFGAFEEALEYVCA